MKESIDIKKIHLDLLSFAFFQCLRLFQPGTFCPLLLILETLWPGTFLTGYHTFGIDFDFRKGVYLYGERHDLY